MHEEREDTYKALAQKRLALHRFQQAAALYGDPNDVVVQLAALEKQLISDLLRELLEDAPIYASKRELEHVWKYASALQGACEMGADWVTLLGMAVALLETWPLSGPYDSRWSGHFASKLKEKTPKE